MWRLVLILAFIPAVVLAQAKEYYGAIAYSPTTRAHGWSFNHPSRTAAEKVALSNCRKLAPDCKTQVWFKNACGALATGSKGPGWDWGDDQATADRRAIAICALHSKACTVQRRFCTSR